MSILIADDDLSIIAALKLLFDSEGIHAEACQSPQAVLTRVKEQQFQLVLLDMNYCKDTTSGQEGLELISNIRQLDEHIPIVVMTGWATISLAVTAMQRGAADFVEKPWDDNNRLLNTIRTQIRLSESKQRVNRLAAENTLLKSQATAGHMLLTRSPAMVKLLETARRIADSDMPVLITGENGTGKSVLAGYIHAHSKRNQGSLITVNMGGISETTFESELFGHVKGAFTDARSERIGRVELAQDGTLFLDEIANTPLSQQAKLLRLLEERQFEKLGSSRSQPANARFVSATNAPLDELVKDKGFREDLLYRLNGLTLHIPPLRERKEDLHLLAEHFLQKARQRNHSSAVSFAPETLEVIEHYSWPGNVRELSHVIERASLLALESEIQPGDLQLPRVHQATPIANAASAELGKLSGLTLDEAESYLIVNALQANHGDAEAAAAALGLSRSALYRRLQKYGIKT